MAVGREEVVVAMMATTETIIGMSGSAVGERKTRRRIRSSRLPRKRRRSGSERRRKRLPPLPLPRRRRKRRRKMEGRPGMRIPMMSGGRL